MSPGPYDQGFQIPPVSRAEIDEAMDELRNNRAEAMRSRPPVVAPTVVPLLRDFSGSWHLGLSETEMANIEAARDQIARGFRSELPPPITRPGYDPDAEPGSWRTVEATPRRLGPIPYGRAMAAAARWLQAHAWASTVVDDWGNR